MKSVGQGQGTGQGGDTPGRDGVGRGTGPSFITARGGNETSCDKGDRE